MDYQQTLDWLYNRLTAFHLAGAKAYKPGLDTTKALAALFGHPHESFKTIHIAGTNGKGSTAHTLAAICQAAGLRTGLYTSPHLVDFAERIRVNGRPIDHDAVVEFTERFKGLSRELSPSFFELATVMAFDWFAKQDVDIAIIECGLGGRLDSTNIIKPVLSIITNISIDHASLLGDTPAQIAAEKAGIIKPGVPVIIGEADDVGVRKVFIDKAETEGSEIIFADTQPFYHHENTYTLLPYTGVKGELTGEYQWLNARTVLTACKLLGINEDAVRQGFANVVEMTGLQGRWTVISHNPLTVIDTGHNPGAWQYLGKRLAEMPQPLHIVVGFVSDKDISHIVDYMPKDAIYYFVQASTPRAAKADDVAANAARHGLKGTAYHTVMAGYMAAVAAAKSGGSVFVGGSNFVVGDLLSALNE